MKTGIGKIRHLKLGYALGGLMIVVGAVSLLMASKTDVLNNFYVISKVALIFFGLFLVLDPYRNNMRAIGGYALAIGLGRVLLGIDHMSRTSDFDFFLGVVLFGLGASLMTCGFNYFKGISKNALRMTVIAYIILITYVLTIAYMLYMDLDVQYALCSRMDATTFMIMYATYIFVLTSPEVTANMPSRRVLYDVDNIRSASGASGEAAITAEDLEVIRTGVFGSPSWDVVASGPVESETCISVKGGSLSTLILQRWRGEELLFVTVTADPDGTFIQGSRFSVTDVVPENGTFEDCPFVRLYGDDVMVARFKIIRPTKEVQ